MAQKSADHAGVISFALTPELNSAVERAAASDGLSKSGLVRWLTIQQLRARGLLGTAPDVAAASDEARR